MKSARTLLLPMLLVTGTALAQQVVDSTQELDFDRPESWAMKYYASLALLTGMGVPDPLGAGGIDLGFEGDTVPQLDEDQRRVGFGGTKVEDLNRTHFFGRVRGRVGLSESLSLDLAYLPPIEMNGVRPHLFGVGIGRPFQVSENWRLGLRGFGQFGTIDGDITCSASEIESGNNPFRCEAPSNDEMSQRVYGVEITTGYVSEGPLRPHVGVAFNYLDLEFQIDALHSGLIDRTLQLTDGGTVALTGGLTYAIGDRWSITGDLFYSWLSVVRPPSTTSTNDGLFNARFLVRYRIR